MWLYVVKLVCKRVGLLAVSCQQLVKLNSLRHSNHSNRLSVMP